MWYNTCWKRWSVVSSTVSKVPIGVKGGRADEGSGFEFVARRLTFKVYKFISFYRV